MEGKEVIVMLDANLDHLTWGQTDTLPASHSSGKLKSLTNLLFEKIIPLGVSQLVTVASRFQRGQPVSGLDHIYTNKPDKLSQVLACFTGLSDHKLLKVTRYSQSFKQLPRYVRKRGFKNFNGELSTQMLKESNINDVFGCNDVNIAVGLLTKILTNILDILAPVKTIQVRSNYVPGLSSETKSLQRERNLAQQKASVTNEAEDWRIFRSLRNRTTASIRKDKKEWEEKKFQCEENSSSDMWWTVKGWLGWQTGGEARPLNYIMMEV